MSVRNRLILLFGSLIVIALTMTGLFTYFAIKHALTQQIVQDLNNLATLTEKWIKDILNANEERATAMSNRSNLKILLQNYLKNPTLEKLKEIEIILINSKQAWQSTESIYIFSNEGKILASTASELEENALDLPSHFAIPNQTKTFSSFNQDGAPLLLTVAPISVDKHPLGAIMVVNKFDTLFRSFAEFNVFWKTGEIILAQKTEENKIKYLLPQAEFSPEEKYHSAFALNHIVAKTLNGILEVSPSETDNEGQKIIIVTRFINPIQWGLVIKVNQKEAFGLLYTIQKTFLIAGAGTLFLMIIFSAWISIAFTKPLFKLIRAADKIKEGKFDARYDLNLTQSTHEVGRLTQALFAMTERLISSQQSLEKQVIERTQELQERNLELALSKKAALSLMEDALEAKQLTEQANQELQRAWQELDQRVKDRTAELRHSEEKIKKTNEELQRANEVKSAFISMVSHELRTPLASMKASVEMLIDEIDGPVNKEQKETLTIAQKNIDRLGKLIGNVLDFTKLEAGKMPMNFAPTNLVKLVEEVYATMKPAILNQNIQFIKDLPAEPVIVLCDGDKIQQVILNLINNALKFTEKGEIVVRLTAHPNEVTLSVSDTGIGIDHADQKMIFEMFGQVYARGIWKTGGSGVGLAVCKLIVSEHKGKISLSSKLGEGSTFSFSIPRENPEPH